MASIEPFGAGMAPGVKCTATVFVGRVLVALDRLEALRTVAEDMEERARGAACVADVATRPAGSLADADDDHASVPHRASPANKAGTMKRRTLTCWSMISPPGPPPCGGPLDPAVHCVCR